MADFSECQKEGFFPKIFKELQEQGIASQTSILVNNVGISNIGYLHELPDKRLFDEININCVPMVLMTNYIVPFMLKR